MPYLNCYIRCSFLPLEGNKYFVLVPEKKFKSEEEIIKHFLQQIPDLQEASTVEECDVILVFCIIVSRVGTNIDTAVNELNALSGNVQLVNVQVI